MNGQYNNGNADEKAKEMRYKDHNADIIDDHTVNVWMNGEPDIVDDYTINVWMNNAHNNAANPNNVQPGAPAGWGSPPPAQPTGWGLPPETPSTGWGSPPGAQSTGWNPALGTVSADLNSPMSVPPPDLDSALDKTQSMQAPHPGTQSANRVAPTIKPPSNKKTISPIFKFGVPLAALIIVAGVLLVFVFNSFGDGNGNGNGGGGGNGGGENGGTVVTTVSPEVDNEKPSASPEDDSDDDDEVYEGDKLVKQILRNTAGEITGWLEFAYHGNGNLMEQAEHNAAGNVIKHTYFNEDGSVSNWVGNEYDELGRRILATMHNKDDVKELSNEFVYNVAGVNTRRIDRWYDENGEILRFEVRDLFGNGNARSISFYEYVEDVEILLLMETFNTNEKLVMSTVFEYEEDGSLAKWYEYEFDAEGDLLLFIHEYNDRDIKVLLTEFDYDGRGAETERREKELNNNGVVVRTRFYRPGATAPYRTDPPATTQPPSTSSPGGGGGCTNPGHGTYDANQTPRTTYDSHGRRDREIYYYRDGCVWYYVQYHYDGNGNLYNITRHYS